MLNVSRLFQDSAVLIIFLHYQAKWWLRWVSAKTGEERREAECKTKSRLHSYLIIFLRLIEIGMKVIWQLRTSASSLRLEAEHIFGYHSQKVQILRIPFRETFIWLLERSLLDLDEGLKKNWNCEALVTNPQAQIQGTGITLKLHGHDHGKKV